jgi:bacteriorhodopsin
MNLFSHLLIYNFVISIFLYGSLAYNPRMWLHRMPPEVTAKVPQKTPQERKLFILFVPPFLLWLFGYPIIYILGQDSSLSTNFFILLAFYAGFALWDTLVLDLLIFCKMTPRFIIIEGTSREDYSNMKYHLASGAKGLVISAAFAGILALILSL